MKRAMFCLFLCGLGFAAGWWVVGKQSAARAARQLEAQTAAWQSEKSELLAALERAHRVEADLVSAPMAQPPVAHVEPEPGPNDLLNELVNLRISDGNSREMRQVIASLEGLSHKGPPALATVREFLASGRDVVYVSSKGAQNVKTLADNLVPATLRLGLFDVVQRIGGAESEEILVENLGRTGSGIEVAYLTEILERMSPGSHREEILAATRSLLGTVSMSDRTGREYLYGVLQRFQDASYVATATAQIIQPNGQVDRVALDYLKNTLGERSVVTAAQTYQDNRLTEPGSKEPLARLALAYVGSSDQAAALFHTAILDQTLKSDQRRELVEDLNQDGLNNRKALTAEDLKMVANRYALAEAYLQQDYVRNDKVLNDAFREAYKDLGNMLTKASANASAAPGR